MTPYEFSDLMRKNKLKRVGGGSKYTYWSFFDHLYGYSVRAGKRNVAVVYRDYTDIQRGYPKMEDVKVTQEVYYGKMSELHVNKLLEVADTPPKMETAMKASILEGIKKKKPIDRDLIRDFAVSLAAKADNLESGGDKLYSFMVKELRKRSESLLSLADEEEPSLYKLRCHVVGVSAF